MAGVGRARDQGGGAAAHAGEDQDTPGGKDGGSGRCQQQQGCRQVPVFSAVRRAAAATTVSKQRQGEESGQPQVGLARIQEKP